MDTKGSLILTPKETVRAYCTHCLGLAQLNAEAVRDCQGDQAFTGPCPFFPYRLGKRIPVRVFRAFCIDCMGGQPRLVKDCPATTCEVFPYRFGKNPALRGQVRGASLISRCTKEGAGGQFSRRESTFRGQSIGKVVSL